MEQTPQVDLAGIVRTTQIIICALAAGVLTSRLLANSWPLRDATHL